MEKDNKFNKYKSDENNETKLVIDIDKRAKRRSSKSLPPNFFERVLDLELKLKRDFSMESLQELVNMFSMAIEYYESIEDLKYMDYQNRLQILLSQGDILNSMNEHSKRKGVSSNSQNNNANKLKKEQEKKQIKLKVNYIKQITNLKEGTNKVQNLIENISNNDENNKKEANNVIKDEITRQIDNFQARLLEKRKKQSLSVFDSNDKIENFDKEKKLNTVMSGANLLSSKSYDKLSNGGLVLNKEILEEYREEENGGLKSSKTDTEIEKTEKTDKYKCNEENIEIILETSFDKEKIDEIDEMFSPFANLENGASNGGTDISNSNFSNSEKLKKNESMISTFKVNETMIDFKNVGSKQKQIFYDIKQTLDQFVNEFNTHFYEFVFLRFTEQVQKLMDEKYNKYIEISKNYHGQIKEMEFLLTGDTEDVHKQGIKGVIDSLKEEQQHELDRIEDHYNKLIIECQADFKNIGFKNNPALQLIEEKFKLDMYNLINLILLPNKKF